MPKLIGKQANKERAINIPGYSNLRQFSLNEWLRKLQTHWYVIYGRLVRKSRTREWFTPLVTALTTSLPRIALDIYKKLFSNESILGSSARR